MAAVLQDKPPRYYTCFFTDDSYFFFRDCPEESAHITRCLRRYEEASGQKINKEKLTISFSPNVPENKKLKKTELCTILGVTESNLGDKYLGMSAIVGRNKKAIF